MSSKNSGDPRRSLFGRLMRGFTGVMLAIWLGILFWDIYETKTYRDDTLQDTKNLARQIAIMMPLASARHEDIGGMVMQLQKARDKGFEERGWYAPKLQMQIWQAGRLVYTSAPLLSATLPMVSETAAPGDGSWVSWTENDSEDEAVIRVSQEVTGKWVFTIAGVGYYLLPLLYSIPFLLIPAWFIIKNGLRPLRTIVTEIEERSSSVRPSSPPRKERAPLAPLPPSPYRELSPLVTSVNRLMQRLSERLDREQEFLLNAAHELKIPLAIIQLNSEGLVDNPDPAGLLEARNGLQQGVLRATHTVHQLLALARSGVDGDHAGSQPLDLVELVQDSLAQAAQIAMARGIEIELRSPDACLLPLHRETAALLIDNLIGNAVKYSPDKGHVTVSIAAEPDVSIVRLVVADEGPGIAPELRHKVFERFFRLPGQEQPGSGLGLSIAERAAARNNARISLGDGAAGKGLSATVEFRLAATAKARAASAGAPA